MSIIWSEKFFFCFNDLIRKISIHFIVLLVVSSGLIDTSGGLCVCQGRLDEEEATESTGWFFCH